MTDSTWQYWRGAIVDQVSTAAYLDELDTVPDARYPLVRRALADPDSFDLLTKRAFRSRWLWRKPHGL